MIKKFITKIFHLLMFFVNVWDSLFCLSKKADKKRAYVSKYIKNKKNIIILTNNQSLYVANNLYVAFKKIGINSVIEVLKDKRNNYHFSKEKVYIILCGIWLHRVPKYYIYYNMEQTTFKHHFPEQFMFSKYRHFIIKSIINIDYSNMNINWLKNKVKKKIYFLPILPLSYFDASVLKRKKIVFAGGFYENSRRQSVIEPIQKQINIDIIKNLYGKEMGKILDESLISLNIHNLKDSILETTRISQALSHNCIVISEESADIKYYYELKNIVDFVKLGDSDQIISRINYWISNNIKAKERITKINNYVEKCNLTYIRYVKDIINILIIK